MKRAFSILAINAALFATHTAAATEHTVLILPDAYFPQITYVSSGDTVRFINMSGQEHDVIAEGEAWAIEDIQDTSEAVISITSDMEATFYNKNSSNDGAYQVQGEFSFDAAPLN
jgi:plastocyanin